MPTLTFYLTDEVATQFEQVIKWTEKEQDRNISRGDLLTPVIKKLHRKLATQRRAPLPTRRIVQSKSLEA